MSETDHVPCLWKHGTIQYDACHAAEQQQIRALERAVAEALRRVKEHVRPPHGSDGAASVEAGCPAGGVRARG